MPDTPLSEVAALARRNDPDRFLCALFAPPARREALFVLIAFQAELARARQVASNPMTALIRLQWWRDALEEVTAGNPVRRHEVTLPLAEAIRAGLLDAAELAAMIDAREVETEEEIPSRAALWAYLRGTSGALAVASGRLLGAPAAAMPALQNLGAAYGLALLLRSIPSLAMHDRCLLPADLLAEANLTPADVIRDPSQPGVAPLCRALAAEGLALARAGKAGLGKLPKGAIAAALPGWLAARDLKRMAGPRWDPAQPLPPRGLGDKLTVAWAGWRR